MKRIFKISLILVLMLTMVINMKNTKAETTEYEISINEWMNGIEAVTNLDIGEKKEFSSSDTKEGDIVLRNKNDNSVINIDYKNLKVSSTKEKYATAVNNDGVIVIEGKAEGKTDIVFSYNYNGTDITSTITWSIFGKNDQFKSGQHSILTDSILELEQGKSEKVSINMEQRGTHGIVFPDGYDESNYYSYKWTSEDEDIVAVSEGADSATATLKGISKGSAKVNCVITTAENETKTETVEVNVSGNSSSSSYELTKVTAMGSNDSMLTKGEQHSPELEFWDNSTNTTLEINYENLKVESSNEDIATIIEKDGKKLINCLNEGRVTIKYTYTYEGKEYTLSCGYVVYDSNDKFSTDEYAYILDSVYNVKAGDTKDIKVEVAPSGSYAVAYPDGYDHSNYYKYEWYSSDDGIVKITKTDDDSAVKITAVKKGEAEIYCTVTTADGKETIKKTAKITVTGENEIEGNTENIGNNDSNTGSKTILPQTGEKATSIILFAIIGSAILSVCIRIKMKNIK